MYKDGGGWNVRWLVFQKVAKIRYLRYIEVGYLILIIIRGCQTRESNRCAHYPTYLKALI